MQSQRQISNSQKPRQSLKRPMKNVDSQRMKCDEYFSENSDTLPSRLTWALYEIQDGVAMAGLYTT